MSNGVNGVNNVTANQMSTSTKEAAQKAKEEGISLFTFDGNNDGKISTEELDNYLKYLDSMTDDTDEADATIEADPTVEADPTAEADPTVEADPTTEAKEENQEEDNSKFDLNGDGQLDLSEQLGKFFYEAIEKHAAEISAEADATAEADPTVESDPTVATDPTVAADATTEADPTAEATEDEVDIMAFDANNDGKITSDEAYNYARYLEATEQAAEQQQEADYDERFDINGDGKMDDAELAAKAAYEEVQKTAESEQAEDVADEKTEEEEKEVTLMTFDANNDGKIDSEELDNFLRWHNLTQGNDEKDDDEPKTMYL